MTLEKATNEITIFLDKWLEEHNFDLTTRFELEFGFYRDINIIAYSLLTTERTDRLFTEYANSLGHTYNTGIFVLSFLHEVGHYMTDDEVSDEEYNFCELCKNMMNNRCPDGNFSDTDIKYYFNLSIERRATQWAVDYINGHLYEVLKIRNFVKNIVDDITVV